MLTIMRETEGRTLVFKATESLTTQDYERVFIPRLKELIDQFGKIRAVLYLDDKFTGWELGAVWDDAMFGIQHRHDFEKIAVVTDQKWIDWATKIGVHFIDGEIAIYPPTEFQDAVTWVKQ